MLYCRSHAFLKRHSVKTKQTNVLIGNSFEIDLLLFQIGSLEQKQSKKEIISLRCQQNNAF